MGFFPFLLTDVLEVPTVVTDFGNCSQFLKLSPSNNVLTGGMPREFEWL
jgi:hypothetical protein